MITFSVVGLIVFVSFIVSLFFEDTKKGIFGRMSFYIFMSSPVVGFILPLILRSNGFYGIGILGILVGYQFALLAQERTV